MDHLPEMQADIDQAAEAAGYLDTSVMQIDNWAALLRDGDPGEVTAAGLRRILLEVADCHTDICADEDCCECEHLRNGLALVLAASRAELDGELERRLRYDPQRRPGLIPRADPGE